MWVASDGRRERASILSVACLNRGGDSGPMGRSLRPSYLPVAWYLAYMGRKFHRTFGAEVPRRFWGRTFLFCQGRRLRPYRAETLVSPKFHLRCNLADEGRNSPGNMGRNFRVLPERAESLALRGGDSGPNIFPPHELHADGRRNFPGSSGPEYFR